MTQRGRVASLVPTHRRHPQSVRVTLDANENDDGSKVAISYNLPLRFSAFKKCTYKKNCRKSRDKAWESRDPSGESAAETESMAHGLGRLSLSQTAECDILPMFMAQLRAIDPEKEGMGALPEGSADCWLGCKNVGKSGEDKYHKRVY